MCGGPPVVVRVTDAPIRQPGACRVRVEHTDTCPLLEYLVEKFPKLIDDREPAEVEKILSSATIGDAHGRNDYH